MVFQRDLVRAAEHFLRVARYVFPSPIGDPCELPRSPFMRTDLGLVPGQLWLSNIDLGDVALSQGLDVSNGRLAEESTVLAAELAHTLVADLVRSACSIETVHQHSLARGLEPQLFLILQRAHCVKRAEA